MRDDKRRANYDENKNYKGEKYSLDNFRGLPEYLEKISQNIHNIDQRINCKGGMNVSNSTNNVTGNNTKRKKEEKADCGYNSNINSNDNDHHAKEFIDIKSIVKQSVDGLSDIFNLKNEKGCAAMDEQNKKAQGLKSSILSGIEVIEEEEHNRKAPERMSKVGKNVNMKVNVNANANVNVNASSKVKTDASESTNNNNNNCSSSSSITQVNLGRNPPTSSSTTRKTKISSTETSHGNDPILKQKKTQSRKNVTAQVNVSEELGNSHSNSNQAKLPQPTPKSKSSVKNITQTTSNISNINSNINQNNLVPNEPSVITKKCKDKIESKISNENFIKKSTKDSPEKKEEQNFVIVKTPAVNTNTNTNTNTNNTNVTVNVNNFINLNANSPKLNVRHQNQNKRYEQEYINGETVPVQVKPSMNDIHNNLQDEKSPMITKNYQLKPKQKKQVTVAESANSSSFNIEGGCVQEIAESLSIKEMTDSKEIESLSIKPTISQQLSSKEDACNKINSPGKHSSLSKNASKTSKPLLQHGGIKDVLKIMLIFNEYILRNELSRDSAIADDYSKLLSTLITFSGQEKSGGLNEEPVHVQSSEAKSAIKIQRAWRKWKVADHLSKNNLQEQSEMKKVLVASLVYTEGYGMKKILSTMSSIVESFNILSKKSKNLDSMTNQIVQLTNGDLSDVDQYSLYKTFLNDVVFKKAKRGQKHDHQHISPAKRRSSIEEQGENSL